MLKTMMIYKFWCLPPPQCLIVDKLYQLSFNFHSHQNILCIPCTIRCSMCNFFSMSILKVQGLFDTHKYKIPCGGSSQIDGLQLDNNTYPDSNLIR